MTEFQNLAQWEDRYKVIIARGKALAPIEERFKVEANLVKGCQSQLWLYGDFRQGKVYFYGDSDAGIVKGILALFLFVYSGNTPDEILNTLGLRPTFVEKIGLREHLSLNRSNGLAAIARHISYYALAFKAKEGGGHS